MTEMQYWVFRSPYHDGRGLGMDNFLFQTDDLSDVRNKYLFAGGEYWDEVTEIDKPHGGFFRLQVWDMYAFANVRIASLGLKRLTSTLEHEGSNSHNKSAEMNPSKTEI